MRSSLLAMTELHNVRLHVLKRHGHGAVEEDPEMLAEVIIRFLEDHGPAQAQPESFYSGAP